MRKFEWVGLQGNLSRTCLANQYQQNLVPVCFWVVLTLWVPESTPLPLFTAPDEAPTILSVTPHTTTSVLIRWQVRLGKQVGSLPRTQINSWLGPENPPVLTRPASASFLYSQSTGKGGGWEGHKGICTSQSVAMGHRVQVTGLVS